ncbi:hypothetical protein [Nioella nitratireducens]|uniref:hypothetical protein n=1 Tax=Nioella nitratireducens TaxID=1287720 RepID=UPI0008FD061F|nr:hypothetical protein [Nioella nitratireducens]
MGRGAVWVSLVLATANPAFAESHFSDPDVALERSVRDDDRGVRAIIRYRPEVMTGGQDEIVNDDGSVSTLYWDGFVGQFSAEIVEGHVEGLEAEAFLREAAVAVCPSVDKDVLDAAWVLVRDATLSLFAQCPEVDETLR